MAEPVPAPRNDGSRCRGAGTLGRGASLRPSRARTSMPCRRRRRPDRSIRPGRDEFVTRGCLPRGPDREAQDHAISPDRPGDGTHRGDAASSWRAGHGPAVATAAWNEDAIGAGITSLLRSAGPHHASSQLTMSGSPAVPGRASPDCTHPGLGSAGGLRLDLAASSSRSCRWNALSSPKPRLERFAAKVWYRPILRSRLEGT